jgi:hypothetical protein
MSNISKFSKSYIVPAARSQAALRTAVASETVVTLCQEVKEDHDYEAVVMNSEDEYEMIKFLKKLGYLVLSRSLLSSKGFHQSLTKPIKEILYSPQVLFTSGSNTALNLVSVEAFNSTNFPELASFAALYDECRVLNVVVHYVQYASTSSASQNVIVGGLAVSYDYYVAGPTTLSQVLQEAHTSGGLPIQCYLGNDSLNMLVPRTCYKLKAKTPKSALVTNQINDFPGSGWFALDTSTAMNIFALRAYAPAGGAGCTITYLVYYELDVEFRLRV